MINIIETKINYSLLNKNIGEYGLYHHGNIPNYLIMNIFTRNKISNDFIDIKKSLVNDTNFYGEYHGIPIAICSKLKDGEIDIV